MKNLCILISLLCISCGGSGRTVSKKNIPGSYSASPFTLDLGNHGDFYWQKTRNDGALLIREGRWKVSGSTLKLRVQSKAVMRGQTELLKRNINKIVSGTFSGKCIQLNGKTYCK